MSSTKLAKNILRMNTFNTYRAAIQAQQELFLSESVTAKPKLATTPPRFGGKVPRVVPMYKLPGLLSVVLLRLVLVVAITWTVSYHWWL